MQRVRINRSIVARKGFLKMNEKYLPMILESITGMKCWLHRESDGTYSVTFYAKDNTGKYFQILSLEPCNIFELMFKVGQWHEADHIGREE